PQFGIPSAVAVDSSGRILVSGGGANSTGTPYLVRLLPNGTQDTSFGPSVGVACPLSQPADIFIDATGNIFLAGTSLVGGATKAAVAKLVPHSVASTIFP